MKRSEFYPGHFFPVFNFKQELLFANAQVTAENKIHMTITGSQQKFHNIKKEGVRYNSCHQESGIGNVQQIFQKFACVLHAYVFMQELATKHNGL
jgi:hypothetical protein